MLTSACQSNQWLCIQDMPDAVISHDALWSRSVIVMTADKIPASLVHLSIRGIFHIWYELNGNASQSVMSWSKIIMPSSHLSAWFYFLFSLNHRCVSWMTDGYERLWALGFFKFWWPLTFPFNVIVFLCLSLCLHMLSMYVWFCPHHDNPSLPAEGKLRRSYNAGPPIALSLAPFFFFFIFPPSLSLSGTELLSL